MNLSRPRRSMLYMPASNRRAIQKSRELPADSLIFDLEDAVAPSAKDQAREQLREEVAAGGFGSREIIVRVNPLNSDWGRKDVAAVAAMAVDGVLFPKVGSADDVILAVAALDAAGAPLDLPLWVMIETPAGVLNAASIGAASRRLAGIVMGTSDLAKDARIPHTPDRAGFVYALSHCVLAARANGLYVIDGVHLVLEDAVELRAHCVQGRELGFDGKSLIHPRQIEIANEVFAPQAAALERARVIIDAWTRAQAEGAGVCVVDGRLIENLHVEEARRILDLDQAIRAAGNR